MTSRKIFFHLNSDALPLTLKIKIEVEKTKTKFIKWKIYYRMGWL